MIYFQFFTTTTTMAMLVPPTRMRKTYRRCSDSAASFRCLLSHKTNAIVYKSEKLKAKKKMRRSQEMRHRSQLVRHSISPRWPWCGADNIFPIFNLSLVNSFRIYDDSWPPSTLHHHHHLYSCLTVTVGRLPASRVDTSICTSQIG